MCVYSTSNTWPTHRVTPLSSSSRMPSTSSSVAAMRTLVRATACMPGEVERGREGDALIPPLKGAATSCRVPGQPQTGGDVAEMLCRVPQEAPRGKARLCRIPWQRAKGWHHVVSLHQGDARVAVLCRVPGEAAAQRGGQHRVASGRRPRAGHEQVRYRGGCRQEDHQSGLWTRSPPSHSVH